MHLTNYWMISSYLGLMDVGYRVKSLNAEAKQVFEAKAWRDALQWRLLGSDLIWKLPASVS